MNGRHLSSAVVVLEDEDFLRVVILQFYGYIYMITKKVELVKCDYKCTLTALSFFIKMMIICS